VKRLVRKNRVAGRSTGLAIGLVFGVVIALMVAIVVMAWIKGGVTPAQMVEIPVDPASLATGGA